MNDLGRLEGTDFFKYTNDNPREPRFVRIDQIVEVHQPKNYIDRNRGIEALVLDFRVSGEMIFRRVWSGQAAELASLLGITLF